MKFVFTTDWHWGNKNNSPIHNQDLHNFTDFLIEFCKKNSIEILIHGGDWYQQRDKLDVATIQSSIECAKKLNAYFGKWYQIKGNHDLYHKNTRDVCSLEILRPYANVIDKFEMLENGKTVLASWITSEDEYQELIQLTKENHTKFLLGHFEFNRFMLNDHYEVEHGHSHKELKHVDHVLSGHFHMRQQKDNVHYVGTPFGYDFNDANDPNRGFVIVDTDNNTVEYVDYNGPLIISLTQDDLLPDSLDNGFDLETLDGSSISLRVVFDRTITDEENEVIKQKLSKFVSRETKIVHKTTTKKEAINQSVELGEVFTIDQAVTKHLSEMSDIDGIDKRLLVELYQSVKQ